MHISTWDVRLPDLELLVIGYTNVSCTIRPNSCCTVLPPPKCLKLTLASVSSPESESMRYVLTVQRVVSTEECSRCVWDFCALPSTRFACTAERERFWQMCSNESLANKISTGSVAAIRPSIIPFHVHVNACSTGREPQFGDTKDMGLQAGLSLAIWYSRKKEKYAPFVLGGIPAASHYCGSLPTSIAGMLGLSARGGCSHTQLCYIWI